MARMGRRTAVAALALGALFLAHVAWLAVVAEDAYISFRFARNWAGGLGLVWNPGAASVEGYTNFLWVAISAVVQRAGFAPGPGAQLIGTAAGLASLALTYAWGRRLGLGEAGALVPCLFLALSGPLATWAASGLETDLFTVLVLGGLYGFASFWERERAAAAWAGLAALLLAMLTRPEGALAMGLALAWAGASPGRARGRAWAGLAAPVGAALALFAAYFVWRWSVFGELLPNTFYAKTGAPAAQAARGVAYAALFARDFLLPWLPLALLAAAAPALRAERRGAWLGLPVLFTAGWALYVVAIGGDYMAMYRFFVPALPFLMLLLGLAARRALAAEGTYRGLALGALALAALGTVFHSTPLEATLLEAPRRMHGNWRGVQTERWEVQRLSVIGRLLGEYGRPGESIGTDAIGAIGWYSGLDVYGVHGLVDPEISRAHRRNPNVGGGWAGHDRRDLERLFAQRPTFVMFARSVRPERPRGAELQADVDPALAEEYGLMSLWLEDLSNGEAGWFTFLERKDRVASGR
jgi:hypothetical protein